MSKKDKSISDSLVNLNKICCEWHKNVKVKFPPLGMSNYITE